MKLKYHKITPYRFVFNSYRGLQNANLRIVYNECDVHCSAIQTDFNIILCAYISELKQVTFLTTRTSNGSKFDVFHQSQPLTQSSDVTHAVRVVKNVTCLSSLLIVLPDLVSVTEIE